MCRFTPRRRRLVTSSRASAPRVHTRETPLNFYSIFSRLPLSFYSSIPSPSLPLSPNCISPLVEPVTITCRDSLSQFSLPKVVELSSLSTDPISSRTKISRSLARLIHLPSNDTRITNVDNLIATILGQCKSFSLFFPFFFLFYVSYDRSLPERRRRGKDIENFDFGTEERRKSERKWRGTGHSHSTHLNGV